jgi:hypothetical protein
MVVELDLFHTRIFFAVNDSLTLVEIAENTQKYPLNICVL